MPSDPIEFRCNPDGTSVPLAHNWEHTIGSDHASMALRSDYRDQLKRCREELGIRHVRCHGLFGREMGTFVKHDGHPGSFHNVHAIWDFLLSIGMKPFVELSFMPEALASGSATVFAYRANVTPPARFADWGALVRGLAMSAVARYGSSEVATWPFEVWNEPNLRAFWRGTQSQYFRLYATSARALKQVESDIQVGGPATADNEWIDEFLEFCERSQVPADFVSTHHYPNDATLSAIDADMETKLSTTQRGVLREQAQDARRRARGKPLYYTEWNSSTSPRFHLHDEPYTAAFIVKTLLDGCGLADVYSFWTFTDLFEEGGFPALPFHGGFGLMTIHGVAKPSYRAFELLHLLGNRLVTPIDGTHPTVDAWVVTDSASRGLTVVITNHTYPGHDVVVEPVLVRLETRRRPRSARLARIDDDNGNAKRRWVEMGSPLHPRPSHVDELHEASVVDFRDVGVRHADGRIDVQVDVPPQGVAMVFIAFER